MSPRNRLAPDLTAVEAIRNSTRGLEDMRRAAEVRGASIAALRESTRLTSETMRRGLVEIDASISRASLGWRADLLEHVRAAASISAEISEAVATRQTFLSEAMAGLRAAGVDTMLPIRDAVARIAEIKAEVGEPYRRVLANIQESHRFLTEAIRPAALAAALDWTARWKELSERQRTVATALQQDGWLLIPTWPSTLGQRLVTLRRRDGKRALDAAVCEIYSRGSARALRQMATSWMALPEFQVRRPIIREALALHREGRYKASIPTLLPHVEGALVDVFAPGSDGVTVPKFYRQNIDDEHAHALLVDGFIATLEAVYGFEPFATTNPRRRTLHRHAILHGRSIRYGSEANSLKVFMMLDLIAWEARAKRRAAAEPEVA